MQKCKRLAKNKYCLTIIVMEKHKHKAFIALGGNIGDSVDLFCAAVQTLWAHMDFCALSSLYETEPWGAQMQRNYLNAVAHVRFDGSPHELLALLQSTENSLGRVRKEHWGARTIDLDILLFDELIIDEQDLKIPHMYLTSRDFFLKPLLELDAKLVCPRDGMSLFECNERMFAQLKTVLRTVNDLRWNDLRARCFCE